MTGIASRDLLDACDIKPLLDGKALSAALSTPPGPWMKDALDVVVAWQLRNPEVTDASAAIEAVRIHKQTTQSASAAVEKRKVKSASQKGK